MSRTAITTLFGLAVFLFSAAASGQTCNTADRSVLLILDASGSMNATLPNGETRIAVAKRAAKGVASLLPDETRLALRLYGSQFPKERRNCRDTHLGVPFGEARTITSAVAANVDAAQAQGYTPIAYSLAQSVNDFPADAKDRVIVIVSDGKETCDGDPVVMAKSLAAQGITIHAVGFVVDTAARGQLQAIARQTGGQYFDAPLGPELPDALAQALAACKEIGTVRPAGPGKLRTTFSEGSPVFNAETEEQVGDFNAARHVLDLPAGIYEVQFGPARWKGIEVRPGETTTIDPGQLRLDKRVGVASIKVVDTETGISFGELSGAKAILPIMPGIYDLKFNKDLVWPYIKVDGGVETVISPAVVSIAGKAPSKARVLYADGRLATTFGVIGHEVLLPPGEYVVELGDQRIPFKATAGQVLEIKSQ